MDDDELEDKVLDYLSDFEYEIEELPENEQRSKRITLQKKIYNAVYAEIPKEPAKRVRRKRVADKRVAKSGTSRARKAIVYEEDRACYSRKRLRSFSESD